MARIVGGIGLPHTPAYPAIVARDGVDSVLGRLYTKAAAGLQELRPDVVLLFSCDHFNTFFLDNYPVLALGIGETALGPNDYTPMPTYTARLQGALATYLRASSIGQGFDVALVQDFSLDHAFMVPVHFLMPEVSTPIVPVFVNGLVPPLPTTSRCFAFGRALAASLADFAEDLRVVAIGSGHFSLEVGGPRIDPGDRSGVPDPDWVMEVHGMLAAGRIGELMMRSTSERMAEAGNIGGELLMWIAMLGTLGSIGEPTWLEAQPRMGHCFGMWQC